MTRHVTYYIPGTVKGEPYYLCLSGPDAELIPASRVEVDPFSRVGAPPLRRGWDDGLCLSPADRRSFVQAQVAYTRATVE